MHDWKVGPVQSLLRRQAVARATHQRTRTGPSVRALETPWLPHQRLACEFAQARTFIDPPDNDPGKRKFQEYRRNHTRPRDALDASEVARFAPDCAKGIRDLTERAVCF